MKVARLLLFALCIVAARPVLAADTAGPPPLRLFGQLPAISSIKLSPDGRRWAAVFDAEDSAQVQVRRLADGELLSVAPAEKAKLRNVMWVGNDHVVVTISTTTAVTNLNFGAKGEWFQLLALDLAKDKRWRPLLGGIENAMNVAAGAPTDVLRDGKPFVFVPGWEFKGTRGVISLFEVNLKSMTSRIVESGNVYTVDWLVGPDGRPAARVDYDQESGQWSLFGARDGRLTRLYAEKALQDPPSLISFGRSPGTLLINRRQAEGGADFELNLADGTLTGPHPELAGDRVVLDRVSKTVIATVDTGLDRSDYRFFSPADQALWRAIAKAFPGEQVRLASWSADRKTAMLEVDGPTNGLSLWTLDRASGRAEFMVDVYTGLGPEQLSPVKSFTYKAADGLAIPAYLTLPRGRAPKGLPLIVLPHGGPASRDVPGFDWWAQALASRGYAVLQPQFRGSDGFSTTLLEAGYGQWGRKMQTDLSDGVRHLVGEGTVDTGRVCIVGASYGGYAAMAGVTVEQGVYRCASAIAGISDLRRMLASERREAGDSNTLTLRFWQRFMGASSVTDRSVDAYSPALLAGRVSVPLQLIHGKDDTVVPIAQSRAMADAMRKAGKPVEVLELAGEDHWLSRPVTRIAMLEALVAFLEKHNPPN
ncbi:alpha/beta hydrolase family protein [Sandarakinorhabdus rubra]|uniref:alpha/beta hydrolase family protein n=1 Tax=Sandarakinorhabdus rubra TaxID=2672568 RepID=UPI0013DC43FC|nr:S9 family peptidase [Sandarakinorhabdus rubra]